MAYSNSGYQGYKVLSQIYADDSSPVGYIMPNIQQISPQAIIVDTGTITFNYPTDVTPTGGSNDDVWYNFASDTLYKKIAGVWTLLLDRVTNDAYIAPVINLTACPVP